MSNKSKPTYNTFPGWGGIERETNFYVGAEPAERALRDEEGNLVYDAEGTLVRNPGNRYYVVEGVIHDRLAENDQPASLNDVNAEDVSPSAIQILSHVIETDNS
jgi:hypothetical protein